MGNWQISFSVLYWDPMEALVHSPHFHGSDPCCQKVTYRPCEKKKDIEKQGLKQVYFRHLTLTCESAQKHKQPILTVPLPKLGLQGTLPLRSKRLNGSTLCMPAYTCRIQCLSLTKPSSNICGRCGWLTTGFINRGKGWIIPNEIPAFVQINWWEKF